MPGIETALTLDLNTDHEFVCTAYTSSAKTATRDVTGFALSWMFKRSLSDADAAALITKTTPASGITIATSTVTVAIADTDLAAGQKAITGFWELKRTDAGLESRLGSGPLGLVRTVHRS